MKSAVEWLAIELYEKMEMRGDGNIFDELLEKAKEMEKQQTIRFAEYVATYPDKNRNVNGEMLHAKSKYDGAERTIDLLEQYNNETLMKEYTEIRERKYTIEEILEFLNKYDDEVPLSYIKSVIQNL